MGGSGFKMTVRYDSVPNKGEDGLKLTGRRSNAQPRAACQMPLNIITCPQHASEARVCSFFTADVGS